MGNPLRKRYFRIIKDDFGKYLALFLLLVVVISQICGFQVADESLQTAYQESFAAYNVEYGNFTIQKPLNEHQRETIERLGVRLNKLFFADVELQDGSKIRVFENRQDMDRACVMGGRLAQAPGEIAIDRMFAANHGLSIGDSLTNGSRNWTIVGLVALSDYSAQFENNSDSMFDSLKFGVSVISADEFQTFSSNELTIRYAWQYDHAPADEKEEKQLSDSFLLGLLDIVHLESYIPRYMNQAIRFAGEDMGDMRTTMTLFFYLSIAIIAFTFGVTTYTTITKEATVIGTLRASGYTRFELLCHYCAIPMLVTLIADGVGIILGCSVIKDVNAAIYYDSYSLPAYTTILSWGTLAKTVLLPLTLMLVIDSSLLWKKLYLSPLSFLRRDLHSRRQHEVPRLSLAIRFFSRFRIRIILQNIPDYIVLFAGIVFAELLLMFGLVIPSNLNHYQETLPDMMMCDYQYILRIPQGALEGKSEFEKFLRKYDFSRAIETSNPDAEKFMAYTLCTPAKGDYRGEPVILYGINSSSRYVNLSLGQGDVYISSAYADKFKLKTGDRITLQEQYEDGEYTFTIQGVYDYGGALALFMPRADLNAMLGYEENMFAGYFSNSRITDIPDIYIDRIIDFDSLVKISRQLIISMGSLTKVVIVFAVLTFLILMYVLSKMIIEKNAQSISMAKILGYQNSEINRLYISSTSIVTVVCLLAALPATRVILQWLYELIVISKLNGWIGFYVSPMMYVEIVLMGLLSYGVVSFLELRKIKSIPMNEALSDVD